MKNHRSRSWLTGLLAAAVCTLLTGALASATDTIDNPKVDPGQVRWHPDFETARQAAEKSGKPILLFQMMGNLDERFT